MPRRVMSFETASKLRLQFKMKAGFFDSKKVRRTINEANAIALSKAGLNVKEAAKRAIGQRAPVQTNKWRRQNRIGKPQEIMGGLYRDITPIQSGKTRPPGQPAKSWLPKRFLYRDIYDYWDASTRSVVIGPWKAPWLNQLHEFGGNLQLTAWRIGVRAAHIALKRQSQGRSIKRGNRDARGRFAANTGGSGTQTFNGGLILWTHKGFRNSKNWERTSISKNARYPARPYMGSKNVAAALQRVPKCFENTIGGTVRMKAS